MGSKTEGGAPPEFYRRQFDQWSEFSLLSGMDARCIVKKYGHILRVVIGVTIATGAAWPCPAWLDDAAEAGEKAPKSQTERASISPKVKDAARRIYEAYTFKKQKPDVFSILAQELGNTRELLQKTIERSSQGAGEEEASLLDAHSKQLRTLLREARRIAKTQPEQDPRLTQLAPRFDKLLKELDDVAKARDPNTRRERAFSTLLWFSQEQSPPSRRKKPPAPTFLVGAPTEIRPALARPNGAMITPKNSVVGLP